MFNGAGVTLPGGYWSGDKLEKDITFRSLNGYSEQALLEIDVSRQLSPCYVTAMLGAMIEKVGCENFKQEHAAGLCMADRQWLMLQFARHLNSDRVWLTSKCSACSLSFDIPLDLSDLPVKAAGKDFPHVHLSVQGCDVVLRVPTGVDQENLTGLSDGSAALSVRNVARIRLFESIPTVFSTQKCMGYLKKFICSHGIIIGASRRYCRSRVNVDIRICN